MKRPALVLAALLFAAASFAGSVGVRSSHIMLPNVDGSFSDTRAKDAGAGSKISYEIHSVDPVANAAYVGADTATVLAAYADGLIAADGVCTRSGTATDGYFSEYFDGVYGNGVNVAFLVVVRYDPGGTGGSYVMAGVVATTTDALGFSDTNITLFRPNATPPVCLIKPEWQWTVVTRPSFDGEPGGGAAPTGGLSKFDAAVEYDGLGHTFDTNALAEAFAGTDAGACAFEYALDAGGAADAATWAAAPHLFTNVGEHTAWYRVTSQYYGDFVHAVRVSVTNTTIVYEARDGGGQYSGAGFGIAVSVLKPASGAAVKYAASASGPWQDEPITFSNACEAAPIHFRIEVEGHDPVAGWRTVTIARRAVTLTSADATKAYDGAPLRNEADPAVGGDGFAPGEGATYRFTGSQTDVGSSANAFTYTLDAGTEAGNYEIATVFGTLTVTAAPTPPTTPDPPPAPAPVVPTPDPPSPPAPVVPAPVAKTYKVKFSPNGGKGEMSAATFTCGKAKKLSKNRFSREGYVFAGWAKSKAKAKAGKVAYKNRQKVRNLTTAGKTVRLYAVWAKKRYTVKFYACGGKGSMSAATFTYGKAKKLPKNRFRRKGCKFAGWARSRALAESDTVAFKNGKPVKNLTKKGGTVRLYAVWKRK